MEKETIYHIAELAHIHISEEEVLYLTTEISAILAYASQLKEVDTEGVEPMHHAVSVANVFRADKEGCVTDLDTTTFLVNASPDHEKGYVKVKAIR